MKYGVTPISLNYVVEAIKDEKGNIDFSRLKFSKLVEESIKVGFKHVEITADMEEILPGSVNEEEIAIMADIAKKNGITYSVHLPLWSVEPSSLNERIRKASAEVSIAGINHFETLNPTSYVYHATGAMASEFSRFNVRGMFKQVMLDKFVENAKKSVKEILENTGIEPQQLAIENVEFPFDFTQKIVDEMETSICFDTGHLLAGYSRPSEDKKYDCLDFWEGNKDRIREFHLHDGEYPNKDHRRLGTGTLPTEKLLNMIVKDNFKGPLVFELALSDAVASRDLCYDLGFFETDDS